MNRLCIKFLIIFSITQAVQINNSIQASTATQQVVTRSSKTALTPDLLAEAKEAKMSILTPTTDQLSVLYQNYPDGSTLFPNNQDVAAKFNTMIASIKKNPDLIEFFRKIHINSLHRLYLYFMKIYTNFNLINPGYSQDTKNPTTDIPGYFADDAKYTTNTKKLIMNHFINLIQAQFGASIVSYVPTTDPDLAVSLGEIFITNDYGLDLKPFAEEQTDPAITTIQAPYLSFLKEYIDFFQTYTSYLSQVDATSGVNQYYNMAQFINNLLHPKDQNQTALTMNPSMFFYDIESMRAIQFIPFAANTIPKGSHLIPWAATAVNAAIKNIMVNGHQTAYFKDKDGNKIANQAQAQKLYILIELGASLFEQELLAQPAWLNKPNDTIKILTGCLGNFYALIDTGILDSTTENVIKRAMGVKISTPTKKTVTQTPAATARKKK